MSKLSPKQLDALDRIQQKPALQQLFFQKINGLKWFDELNKRGFFYAAHNPRPQQSDKEGFFIVPAWPILTYLEKIAPELQYTSNKQYTQEVLGIIRKVTKQAIEDGYSNYRTWWYFSKTLNNIPIDLLAKSDVELMHYWLSDPFDRMLIGVELGRKLLPRLLAADTDHSRSIALGLTELLTSIRWNRKKGTRKEDQEPVLPVDTYHAAEILKPIAKLIGETLEKYGVELFCARLKEVLKVTGRDKYSTLWRRAIEDHEQNRRLDNVLDIFIDALRDSLLGYVDRRAAAAIPLVEGMLNSEFELFRRIAIHTVRVHHIPLNGLISKVLRLENFSSNYQHETFHFLRDCFQHFDDNIRQRALDLIEKAGKQAEAGEGRSELHGAYERLEWLSAIKGLGFPVVDGLYEKYLGLVGQPPDHPDFSSYSEVGWVSEASPYTAEQLLSRDFDDLVNILTSFKEEGGWKAPTRRGLAQELRKALALKPEYFAKHLQELVSVDFDYLQELLAGYGDLWKEKKYDNWDELLAFCHSVLHSPGFWEEKPEPKQFGFRATNSWVVGQIADLIKAGTISDENAFDPRLLPAAKSLLEYILDRQQGDPFETSNDAITTAINSARGRAIEALINYALRCCRLVDEPAGKWAHEEVWASELQPMFDKEIERSKTGNYEFVALFGQYIPNLRYLNKEWTLMQLPVIFDKTNRKKWICAMEGYGYNNSIYKDVYTVLRDESHFKSALDIEELDHHTKEKIIQNILVAYFQGDERIDDHVGILRWLLDRRNKEELHQIIWFVWTLRSAEGTPPTAKILALWKSISDLANPEIDDGRALLSKLSMWSVFITEFDAQVMELLKKVAPFIEKEHNAYILIEELKKFVDKHPQEVADIFLAIMGGCAPTYQQEDVEFLLNKLFQYGLPVRDKVNAIVDAYVERGIEFPASIRAKYA